MTATPTPCAKGMVDRTEAKPDTAADQARVTRYHDVMERNDPKDLARACVKLPISSPGCRPRRMRHPFFLNVA
jgi:hypothetical protein